MGQAISYRPLTRSPGCDGRSFHVGFVLDTVALEQVCLRVFWFSPVRAIPPVLRYHLSVTEAVQS